MQGKIEALVTEHGSVPPPWALYDEHPYSISWRMGGGEEHIMLWWDWWNNKRFGEEQRIAYFRQWAPPACWLGFLIEAVWGDDATYEENNLGPYFERTAVLGFGTQQDYERDLDDPKWLKR